MLIHPSLLARTDGNAYRVDVSGRVKYTNDKKVMYAGLSYSPANSVTVMIGGDFHGVSLGYSYEIYTSAISIGNGGHELFMSYRTDVNPPYRTHPPDRHCRLYAPRVTDVLLETDFSA